MVPSAFAVLAWGIGGLGMGVSYSPLSLVVLDQAEPGSEGTASAALQLSDTLGVALGTGVAGAIVAAGTSLHWTTGTALSAAFTLCAVVALATSVGALRLPTAFRDSVR